jgi:hypothetical protein
VQIKSYPLLLLFCLSVPAFAQARRSNDAVLLRNGDRITGEIRSLQNGDFTIQPTYAKDPVVIDWSEIDRIDSTQTFVVRSSSGGRLEGHVHGSREENLWVEEGLSEGKIPLSEITAIEPVGSTLWTNLHGNIDAGLSFTGSTSQQSATVQMDLMYITAAKFAKIDVSDQFATQVNAKDTNEMLVKSLLYRQVKQSKTYVGTMANFLSSSKQDIALRSTIGMGAARYLLVRRHADMNGIAGIAYTDQVNQQFFAETQRSLDGVVAVNAEFYRFSAVNFVTSDWIYPGLTDAGRLRMTLSQSVYYKLTQGPYVRFSVYDYFDNQPQLGTPTNNIGGVLSVGWAFH